SPTDRNRIVYSRIDARAKRTSLKDGANSPRATNWSRPTNGTRPGGATPFVTAAKLGTTWKKPEPSLPNVRSGLLAGRGLGNPLAITHFVPTPPGDWTRETCTWSGPFERALDVITRDGSNRGRQDY